LQMTVTGNMESYGHTALLLGPNQTVIVMEVVNTGLKRTNFPQLFATGNGNWWQRVLRRDGRTLVVQPDPALANPLPFVPEPGARWLSVTYQGEEVKQLSRNGHFLVQIFHSVAKRRLFYRLVIPSDV
jgi:hypothetical protein